MRSGKATMAIWVGVPIALLLGGVVVFLLGMRFKVPFVVNGVRRMNRAYMNPKQLQTAGAPGAYAGILHHVGRTSGKQYDTPLGFMRVGTELAVLLPYGPETDWMRNLMESGSATITFEGETIAVDDPRVVPAEAIRYALSSSDRRFVSLFGIEDCLLLSRAG